MSEEILKVVIKGDASDLDKASSKAAKSLDRVSNSARELQRGTSFNVSSAGITELTNRLDDLIAKEARLKNASNQTFDPASLAAYSRALKKVRAEMGPVAARLDELQEAATKVTPATNQASIGFKKTASAAGQANFAMLSLSQGIGDLQYGFPAIANNLQQTTQAFSYLLRTTQGTKKGLAGFGLAFRSLGATLMGPTGIFVAISVITSAISYFSSKSKDAEKEVDDLKNKIDELNKSLRNTTDVQGETIKSTADQAAKLNLLYSAATDVTRSQKERLAAAKKLQQSFPDTFSNLSQLEIISGSAANAFDRLSNSILQVGKAQAVLDQVVQNYKTIGNATKELDKARDPEKLRKLTQEFVDAQSAYIEAQKNQKSLGGNVAAQGGAFVTAAAADRFNKAKEALNAYSNQIGSYVGIISEATKNNEYLQKSFDAIQFDAGVSDNAENTKQSEKETKKLISEYDKLNERLKQIAFQAETLHLSLSEIIKLKVDALTDSIKALGEQGIAPTNEKLQDLINLRDALSLTKINPIGFQQREGIGNPFGEKNKAPLINPAGISTFSETAEKNKNATKSWTTEIMALQGAFEAVWEGLKNGDNIFDILAKAVEQLIVKLVTATAAAALLNALTGGSAGGALSALGGISKIFSYASGGFIPGPQLAVVGDAPGGEWVLNRSQMAALLNSGSGSTRVTGEFVLRGTDLVASFDTTKGINNRRNG